MIAGAAIILSGTLFGSVACAQLVGLTDEIIVLSRGVSRKETDRKTNALGRVPGSAALPFHYDPGGRDNHLEDELDPARSRVRLGGGNPSALSALSSPRHRSVVRSPRMAMRLPQTSERRIAPLYGLLDLPSGEVEGPPNGLTLDEAIARLLRRNPDLSAKRFEIPEARADILTASQRSNPFYFVSASNFPYQPYSTDRPGGNQYSASIVQPFDINRKRDARMQAAASAVRVLEAQYQNAVRLAIDDLYVAFTDVIVERDTLRYAEVSLAGARTMLDAARKQAHAGEISESDELNLAIQYETASLGLDQERSELFQAKHRLAALLMIPREQAAQLELRGLVKAPEAPLPDRDDLVRMALDNRPDVMAFRLGIHRAQADVQVARKEWVEDLFVVYSPYQFQNNAHIGGQNATSFSVGLMSSIPLYDRNQGEVRRAELNVAQTRSALDAREREAIAEVERSVQEYYASREAVRRIEKFVLPASEKVRAIAYREHEAGRTSTVDYLFALRDRNEIVRQYRDALIRHRRSMLQLNTAVGRRLLP
ncbi:MAG TPA: TolC family protein [Pirellulales bacterium]|nr:TolC family protein [Pirellulales bacterium]